MEKVLERELGCHGIHKRYNQHLDIVWIDLISAIDRASLLVDRRRQILTRCHSATLFLRTVQSLV